MSIISNPAPASASVPLATPDVSSAGSFYRVVWRWHFYAGLFVIPFMIMLAITGSVYLFKPQLDRLMYPLVVQPAGAMQLPTQQLAAVQAAYPDATIKKFMPSPAADRSAEVGVSMKDERNLTVFVNPYTGAVLGERDDKNNLQYYAKAMHGELLIGTTGDRLIELAACWGIMLMISGLFLWWPRTGSRVWGVLLPRLSRRNRRLFWRDLHAVTGFWGALIILFMLLTGLPWTGFWGDRFAKVWNHFPPMWADTPTSTVPTGSLNQNGETIVPWAAEQLPMPLSDPAKQGAHQSHGNSAGAPLVPMAGIAPGTPVNLDSVVALAQAKAAAPGFSVSLPADATGVYTVSAFTDDPTEEMVMHIDQYSGNILADVRWAQYSLVAKSVEMGISLHEGKYFGLLNQLVMFVACLIVLVLSVSATVLWWRRRPAGRLGAPAMPHQMPVWKGAVVLMLVLGVMFPLMGASLVVVLLLDYLVLRRVPMLAMVLR